MAESNSYRKGTLTIGGVSSPIMLGCILHSDIERDPPKNPLKRLAIKDSDRNYHLPDEVDGIPLVGFEDQWARGWPFHGYYSMGKNVAFIPFHFFGIEDRKYDNPSLPSILTKDGGKKWRIDFYKKAVVRTGSFCRVVGFTVKGGHWTHTNTDTNEKTDLFNLSFADQKIKKCINIFAGTGYSINRFHWNRQVLDQLEGWRPCLVRDDLDEPFYIEYDDQHAIYD